MINNPFMLANSQRTNIFADLAKERAALEWLDHYIRDHGDSTAGDHARTVEALLGCARERAIHECVTTLRKAENSTSLGKCIESLQALLPPKTKEVEVWHVAFVARDGSLCVNVIGPYHDPEAAAKDEADRLRVLGCVGIKVTGPHKQTVPAD